MPWRITTQRGSDEGVTPQPRIAQTSGPPWATVLPARCLRCSGAGASSSRSRGGSGCRSDWRDPGCESHCCPGTAPLWGGNRGNSLRHRCAPSTFPDFLLWRPGAAAKSVWPGWETTFCSVCHSAGQRQHPILKLGGSGHTGFPDMISLVQTVVH